MSVDFKNSETRFNLMRAFAGESQARNRYTFAAEQAKKQNLHVIETVMKNAIVVPRQNCKSQKKVMTEPGNDWMENLKQIQ